MYWVRRHIETFSDGEEHGKNATHQTEENEDLPYMAKEPLVASDYRCDEKLSEQRGS